VGSCAKAWSSSFFSLIPSQNFLSLSWWLLAPRSPTVPLGQAPSRASSVPSLEIPGAAVWSPGTKAALPVWVARKLAGSAGLWAAHPCLGKHVPAPCPPSTSCSPHRDGLRGTIRVHLLLQLCPAAQPRHVTAPRSGLPRTCLSGKKPSIC